MFTIYIVAAVLHFLCHVSIDHCVFVLNGIKAILHLVLSSDQHTANAITADIPNDVRFVISALDLKPVSKGYCCCPKCFACYPLEDFPDHCTSTEAPGAKACGRTLRRHVKRDGRTRAHAVRRYLYHDLKAWMGEMLCRPGMEDYLDRELYNTDHEPGEMHDIWDGRILKTFTWADGQLFAGKKNNGEGRYVFALNMDGFNPFMNKHGGTSASCGAIYMVCLNLPPHLRTRVENMFLVSIIPGPHHPSLVQINELLRPLVDDLITFWYKGVYYSRTHNYSRGRLVRCALVPLICDLPAARQMMAFASHSSKHFCCYCGLESSDIDNVNMGSWPKGVDTREEWVAIAEQWKASSLSARKALFEQHGIRYSELLRLPYWDPTRFVVIDSMHAIFLTDLRHHCRDLWGMNVKVECGNGNKARRGKAPDEEQMNAAWDILRRGTTAELCKLGANVLRELCVAAHVSAVGNRNRLIRTLQEHVSFPSFIGDEAYADTPNSALRNVG